MKLLGLLLALLLAVVIGKAVFDNLPTTQWALAWDVDGEPMDARIVQYVRNHQECADTANRLNTAASNKFFDEHHITPEAFAKLSPQVAASLFDMIPKTPRCIRIDHYRDGRTSIQFVDE